MEACATAHDWAREIGKLGHGTRGFTQEHEICRGQV
jgi:hypothetical protein